MEGSTVNLTIDIGDLELLNVLANLGLSAEDEQGRKGAATLAKIIRRSRELSCDKSAGEKAKSQESTRLVDQLMDQVVQGPKRRRAEDEVEDNAQVVYASRKSADIGQKDKIDVS